MVLFYFLREAELTERKSGKAAEAEQIDLFPKDLESFVRGKDEMNLAEFPIGAVAEAAKPGQLTLRFSDSITDQSTGETVDRSVTVSGTEEWGLPAAQACSRR